jgi:dTDP-4-amino-4,6-dideoxygalactose transaminase
MTPRLALHGGPAVVSAPLPHEVWPPPPTSDELAEILWQRNHDISIKGRTGPIKALEDEARAVLVDDRPKYCVSFNSGTSALLAAYVGLGVGPGDEVIGPALTFHAALSPSFLLGATVKLVDIRRDDRCLDANKLVAAFSPRTKVVVVVHQWGHPADMAAVTAAVRGRGIKILEDCSHAHGSRLLGRPCGTFGDAAVFSLQANKAVYAGEGGLMVTDDPEVYARATLLGHYRDRCHDELSGTTHARFWATGFGQKFRMSPLNAVVARHALKRFPEVKAGRARCLSYFRERLAEVPYIEPPPVLPGVDMGGWYGFKPLVRPEWLPGVTRAVLVRAIAAEGVDISAPSGGLLAREPLFAEPTDPIHGRPRAVGAFRPGDFPVAEHVEAWGLSLPTFYNPTSDLAVIDQYIDAFIKVGRAVDQLADKPIDSKSFNTIYAGA